MYYYVVSFFYFRSPLFIESHEKRFLLLTRWASFLTLMYLFVKSIKENSFFILKQLRSIDFIHWIEGLAIGPNRH